MPDSSTGVVVIGGGSTGAGILRDLAMRGIDAMLVEQGDLASGTTGHSHGLLHSGARYCVTDQAAAFECAGEGQILRRIAASAIEDTGGYFVTVTEDDEAWAPRFIQGCAQAGIRCEPLSVAEARSREPAITSRARRAFWIQGDAHLDAVALVRANIESAQRLGARVRTQLAVTGALKHANRITGVVARDSRSGEEITIGCKAIVNATGPWAGLTGRALGVRVPVGKAKGTMVVLSRRVAKAVINRCHHPSNGDIIVPAGGVSVLGTTSTPVDDPGDATVAATEVRAILDEAAMIADGLDAVPVLRSYAGVRPLAKSNGDKLDQRALSRDFLVLDHETRDSVIGIVSIVGGKATTYRLMAERVTDRVARRLEVANPCRTAEVPLEA